MAKACRVNGIEDSSTVTKGGSGPPSEYPVFKRWNFTTTVPISEGISDFTVQVTDKTKTDVSTAIYTNNGHGYPYDDTLLIQPRLSCFNPSPDGFLNVTVAVCTMCNYTVHGAMLTLVTGARRR